MTQQPLQERVTEDQACRPSGAVIYANCVNYIDLLWKTPIAAFRNGLLVATDFHASRSRASAALSALVGIVNAYRGQEGRARESTTAAGFEWNAGHANARPREQNCHVERWHRRCFPPLVCDCTPTNLFTAVACVLANWDNVLRAISLASSKLERMLIRGVQVTDVIAEKASGLPDSTGPETEESPSESRLPATLVRIPADQREKSGE